MFPPERTLCSRRIRQGASCGAGEASASCAKIRRFLAPVFTMSDFPTEIPAEFHSEYEGRPFQSCTRCGEMLSEIAEGYQIFKLFRRGEAIYEYALCHPCHA